MSRVVAASNGDHAPVRVSRYQRGYRFLPNLRGYLRDSILFAPLVGLLCGFLLASVMINATVILDEQDLPPRVMKFFQGLGEGAQAAIGTMASAMLTFVGVIFSITLVGLQMASNVTPRVVRLYVRSGVTKLMFALCLATFIYTLRVQKEVVTKGASADPKLSISSYVAATVATGLVSATLVMFVFYVNNTIRLMRVTYVIAHVARETHRVLDYYERAETGEEITPNLPPVTDEIVFSGSPGVLRDIYTAGFVRQAQRAGVTLRLLERIGDPMIEGRPLVAVHGVPRRGVAAVGWRRRVLQCAHSSQERSMAQDLGFGIRQLVDIASKALSPAVNDPTTAVQSLDRIHVLLRRLAPTELGDSAYTDRRGQVRLVVPVPSWEELVALAFTEIRTYGAGNPQLTRRLAAALDDLEWVARPEHVAALREQKELLAAAVGCVDADPVAKAFGLAPDPQGIR